MYAYPDISTAANRDDAWSLQGDSPLTFTDDAAQVRSEFKSLRTLFDRYNPGNWNTCSMGMSGDWRIAVDEGSTLVRVGSAIFGSR